MLLVVCSSAMSLADLPQKLCSATSVGALKPTTDKNGAIFLRERLGVQTRILSEGAKQCGSWLEESPACKLVFDYLTCFCQCLVTPKVHELPDGRACPQTDRTCRILSSAQRFEHFLQIFKYQHKLIFFVLRVLDFLNLSNNILFDVSLILDKTPEISSAVKSFYYLSIFVPALQRSACTGHVACFTPCSELPRKSKTKFAQNV